MQQCHALAASMRTRAPPAQVGCAENDPNSPVFDPVHGVVHHFYQDHLSTNRGHGPIYGHWVSKDFVNWRATPPCPPSPSPAPPRLRRALPTRCSTVLGRPPCESAEADVFAGGVAGGVRLKSRV